MCIDRDSSERTAELRKMLAIAATGVLLSSAVAACGDSDKPGEAGSGDVRIGVVLPNTQSAQRWKKDEAYFRSAFEALGVRVDIRYARGGAESVQKAGDDMIDNGVKVLILANEDSVSGKAALRSAKAKKVKTIDYDRLTLNGGADYVVSFDNERIGELQGYGLTKCLRLRNAVSPMVVELNGATADGNATFLKDGYDFVLQTHYDNGDFRKGPDQFVPNWGAKEGRAVFEQMLRQQPKISAVLAANDDIAGSVIDVLKKHGMAGKVPVTGQDATVDGLRNVLSGDQCLTIYKRLKSEAYTAASMAVKLLRGDQPAVSGTLEDPESGLVVPFASIPPVPVEAEQVKDVVEEGAVSKDELCKGAYVALCKQYEVE
jgi:D-xylose transport system substrate-binding protein